MRGSQRQMIAQFHAFSTPQVYQEQQRERPTMFYGIISLLVLLNQVLRSQRVHIRPFGYVSVKQMRYSFTN
jgi:hypothetical protein